MLSGLDGESTRLGEYSITSSSSKSASLAELGSASELELLIISSSEGDAIELGASYF